jgi:hypothetical protein
MKQVIRTALVCIVCAAQTIQLNAATFNDRVMETVEAMPAGGGYEVSRNAAHRLCSSVNTGTDGRLVVKADLAQPSYCSGATYLVFLKALQPELDAVPNRETRTALAECLGIRNQPDGVGIWGRWNANGPGTAKFFADARLGRSFRDHGRARPGDFLKIWWKPPIGRDEAGHSVIYLGPGNTPEGDPGLLIWSSNKPLGYGKKVVPFSKISSCMFTRCEHPENIENLLTLPDRDVFLADMLKRNATSAELDRFVK